MERKELRISTSEIVKSVKSIPQFMRLLKANGFRFQKLEIKQDQFLEQYNITADNIVDFMRHEGREGGRIYFVGSKILYLAYRRDADGKEIKVYYNGREVHDENPYDILAKMYLNDGVFELMVNNYRNKLA